MVYGLCVPTDLSFLCKNCEIQVLYFLEFQSDLYKLHFLLNIQYGKSMDLVYLCFTQFLKIYANHEMGYSPNSSLQADKHGTTFLLE